MFNSGIFNLAFYAPTKGYLIDRFASRTHSHSQKFTSFTRRQ